MMDCFDVLVVGAGPGGIAAATVSAEAGQRVCLLDDNATPGGQIWRGFRAETARQYPHGAEFLQWESRLRRTRCEIWMGWRAIDSLAPNVLRLEREGECRDVEFRRLVLATGARERFLPFPGWTLPGVMGAGGAQALVKAGMDARGKRVVVAGSGPLLLAIAAGLARAGAQIIGIYEQAPLQRLISFGLGLWSHPGKLIEGVQYRRILRAVPYRTSAWVARAEGSGRLERVTVLEKGKQRVHECDWLACGFHLVPNLELPRLLGCRIDDGYVMVDSLQQSSVKGIACIGELTGIGGLDKAVLEGQIAGWAASGRDDEAKKLSQGLRRFREFAHQLDGAFALRPELREIPEGQTFVCRCEDVPFSELKHCSSWREAKLHTRCGMGACQGRICGAATEYLFGWNDAGQRPPVFPAEVVSVSRR